MDFDDPIAEALANYTPDRLAAVGAKLFRARIGQPANEILDRITATHRNPPVVDRVLKGLSDDSRNLLAALGRSRQPTWRMDELLALTAALDASDGFPIVAAVLDHGMAVAVGSSPVKDFESWFAATGGAGLVVVPVPVLGRAAALPLNLAGAKSKVAACGIALRGDGLDWPLRLAAARQLVRIAPVKLTQAGTLYKRDLGRFTSDAVLQSPLTSGPAPADAGLLALSWTRGAKLVLGDLDLETGDWPVEWSQPLPTTIAALLAALFAVKDWDPLTGDTAGSPSATSTVGLLLALLLAEEPNAFHAVEPLAEWLWEHHPHWSGLLSKDAAKTHGAGWVDAWLQVTLLPLGLVESLPHEGLHAFRLTDLGRHLLANASVPPPPAAFSQTLLVQPNGELLVYRQGLTPALTAQLSSFAGWKQIGAACTLELTAESVTRGLEDGGTLEEFMQALNRHGMKPMPSNVADLLRRWADKRERLVVYPSATLVEFASAADLDAAIAGGIVSIRLTDRVGLTSSGADPQFQHLRLIGNRDYEAPPAVCVVAEDDGVTLKVDAAAADLLLDAEIARFAEALPATNSDARRYRMTPATLKTATDQGQSLAALDDWFHARSGEGLPAAAKLFLVPSPQADMQVSRPTVVETPTSEIADGIAQWPATAGFIARRLGPTALVVDAAHVEPLRERLAAIGIRLGDGSEHLDHLNGSPAPGRDGPHPAEEQSAGGD